MQFRRLSFAALVVLCAASTPALFAVAVWRDPSVLTTFPPPCVFRKATGIYCPGCGSTRALRALFEGDFFAALRYNPLSVAFLFALPLLLVLRRPRFRPLYYRLAAVVCAVVLVFAVLRNVPSPAFNFLRPPTAAVSSPPARQRRSISPISSILPNNASSDKRTSGSALLVVRFPEIPRLVFSAASSKIKTNVAFCRSQFR
jgi:hypothetical protein